MIQRFSREFSVFGRTFIVGATRDFLSIHRGIPKDMDPGFSEIYNKCKLNTMTSVERMYGLYKSVQYVLDAKILGDFVECGVWKGGSSMLMAHTLRGRGELKRKLWLYDTFAGMPEPTEKDKRLSDSLPMGSAWKKSQKRGHNEMGYSALSEVKANMASTGYPAANLEFVMGKVEDTIPKRVPGHIAILRLDTDWYESTAHELDHLFPRLSKGGVLIIDDYGHFAGAKEAVDRYLAKHKVVMLLDRIDYTSRFGIKQ